MTKKPTFATDSVLVETVPSVGTIFFDLNFLQGKEVVTSVRLSEHEYLRLYQEMEGHLSEIEQRRMSLHYQKIDQDSKSKSTE